MSSTPVARWLRGWIPGPGSPHRRVQVPVVADVGDRAEVWMLEVSGSRNGHGGLVADSRMSIAPDDAFTEAVANAHAWAWARESFPRRATPPWTVTWCLSDSTGSPASGPVSGGSLGAAFGIALAQLFGLGVSARRRMDPTALVSAGLDSDGRLTAVTGLDTKVRALGTLNARLLVAESDLVPAMDIRIGDHPAVYGGTKAADAIAFARAPRHRSVPITLAVILVVVALAGWAVTQGLAAADARRTRLAQQLAGHARQQLASDPASAALSAAAAVKLRPDESTAQASLMRTVTVDPRLESVLVPNSSAMTISPDGTLVAHGGDEHRVTLTRTDRTASPISARAGGGRAVVMAFSGDGRVLVTGDDTGVVVQWDTATLSPTPLVVPVGYAPGPVRALAVDFRGLVVGVADSASRMSLHTEGRSLSAWGLQAGGNVTAMVFTSADTLVVAAIGLRGTQQLTTVSVTRPDLRPRELLPLTTSRFVTGVSTLAVSGDGRTFASGHTGGSVTLWDAVSLTQRTSMKVGGDIVGICLNTAAETALITTTGTTAFSTSVDLEGSVATTQLWDLRDQTARSAPFGGDFRTALVAADRELRTAAVRGTDGAVSLWTDLDSDRMRQDGVVVDIVPDPRYASRVITAGSQGRIDFVDAESGRTTFSFAAAGPEPTYSLAVNRTGQLLATGHSDGTVLLRDRNTGEVRGSPLKAGSSAVYRVAFSPAADLLVTGSGDGGVRLWDTTLGTLLREWNAGADVIHQVMFDATGARIYIADSRSTGLELKGGLWWVSTDGNEVNDHQDTPYPARGMTSTSNGNILIGTADGTLSLTDTRLRALPGVIPVRHRLNILALSHSPRSGRVVVSSSDNRFSVLRADDLSLMVDLPGADAGLTGEDSVHNGLYSAAITGDGRFALVGGHGGRIRVVPLAADLLAERACHLAGRPATYIDLGVAEDAMSDLDAPC